MAGGEAGGGEGETFPSVAGPGEARLVVRGSEFVARVAPAQSVEDAESFVDSTRAAHPDATHNVPAYRVRQGGLLREYHSDEDEPTGSAGRPALTVLQRRDLENVVVVVSRYFGGTELGVGGLARAYADAVSRAVDAAGVVESVPVRHLTIRVGYDDSGTVRGIVESEGLPFEADYAERVTLIVTVPDTDAAQLSDRVLGATGGRADVEVAGRPD